MNKHIVAESPTPDSVAAARWHQQSQRELVHQVTGIRIRDEEPITVMPRLVVAQCWRKGCLYVVAKDSQELAQRAISTHFSLKHGLALVGR